MDRRIQIGVRVCGSSTGFQGRGQMGQEGDLSRQEQGGLRCRGPRHPAGSKAPEQRREGSAVHGFSDSQAAIARVQHDRTGPAQALARAAIETVSSLTDRDSTITLRWTPAHRGVEGNEQADETARRAAEGNEGRAEPSYLLEASLAHLSRKTTETRANATEEWIRGNSGRKRRYRPPRGGKMSKALARARKELAGRFY